MKNRNIFKLGSVAVMALATLTVFTPPAAKAQSYGVATANLTTNFLAAASASNSTFVVDCRYNRDLYVSLGIATDAAGTANVSAVFEFSPDNTGTNTYDTSHNYTLIAPAVAAGSAVITSTNWDALGAGYMKLLYVTNAAATANVTNLFVKVGIGPIPK